MGIGAPSNLQSTPQASTPASGGKSTGTTQQPLNNAINNYQTASGGKSPGVTQPTYAPIDGTGIGAPTGSGGKAPGITQPGPSFTGNPTQTPAYQNDMARLQSMLHGLPVNALQPQQNLGGVQPQQSVGSGGKAPGPVNPIMSPYVQAMGQAASQRLANGQYVTPGAMDTSPQAFNRFMASAQYAPGTMPTYQQWAAQQNAKLQSNPSNMNRPQLGQVPGGKGGIGSLPNNGLGAPMRGLPPMMPNQALTSPVNRQQTPQMPMTPQQLAAMR